MKIRQSALVLLATLAGACGEPPSAPDAEADRSASDATDIVAPTDVVGDVAAPREDARADVFDATASDVLAMDAGSDVAADVGADAAADAVGDGARDVAAMMDASVDAQAMDVVVDVAVRADVTDAAVDRADGSTSGDAGMGIAPPPSVLTASWYNGCAIRAGVVRCWGLGDDGQLGNGALLPSPSPSAAVTLATPVDRVVSWLTHACARTVTGEVHCWGFNGEGVLGDGTTMTRSAPVRVLGVSDARHIATSIAHGCAARGDGAVQCWGSNRFGQLGDGTSMVRTAPVTVSAVNSAVEVSTGGTHSCARLAAGTVVCWGNNGDGQLGNGSTTTSMTPVLVTGLSNVVEMASGGGTNCARDAVGAVFCWGRGDRGQRGDGTSTSTGSTATRVMGLSRPAVRITVGETHACAVLDDGSTSCWGGNDRGQFANGVSVNFTRATTLSFVRPAVHIAAGSFHTCVEHADQSVSCWGESAQNLAPVALAGFSAAMVTAGYRHTCALVGTTPHCWGANLYGELGDGTVEPHVAPAPVMTGGAAFAVISAGNTHTCGLVGDSVRCWGNNAAGQLGDGSMTSRSVPTAVLGLTGVVRQVSSGYQSTCARRDDGSVWCWGSNTYGELGDGTVAPRTIPVPVVGVTDATQVAVGVGGYACAIRTGGAVWCWGRVPGLGANSLVPVRIGAVTNVAEIAPGYSAACLRFASGQVQCFGSNFYGQLGDGTTASHSAPAPVTGLTDAVELRSSANFVCARRMDNSVVCWGNNNAGMLGDRTLTNRTTPVAVAGLTSVMSIAPAQLIGITSDGHSCAIRTGGSVACWGQNWHGQLGRREITFTP